MNNKVMILGATGNFGSKIAQGLAKKNVPLILVARHTTHLLALKNNLQQYSSVTHEIISFDIKNVLQQQLSALKPLVVINTCGPFQSLDYSAALACANNGIHYIDLADARNFVNEFQDKLNNIATQNNCLLVTGASTVPGLSSAVLAHYRKDFVSVQSLKFGITPGQKTERGLATTRSILSYLGKKLSSFSGLSHNAYGWQNLYRQDYPTLGKRWMANCDIPDLDLLPKYYGLSQIQFSAGMESGLLHLSMWLLSWLVRIGFPINLEKHAPLLLKLSHLTDRFGTDEGGMHMIITGNDKEGRQKKIKWFIVARSGDGPHIPTIPAIILTKKLIEKKIDLIGAMPCVGLITLEEYLTELSHLDISVYTDVN